MKRRLHKILRKVTAQCTVASRRGRRSMRDRLTYTAARWITADFRRFYNEYLTTDEMTIIARLEVIRRSKLGLRAYILDPEYRYPKLMMFYSAYVATLFDGGPRAALLVRNKIGLKRAITHDCPRLHGYLQYFSGRTPDHIRGFGGYTSVIVTEAEGFARSRGGDPVGRRVIQAATSAIIDIPGTSLIIYGFSVKRRSRLFSQMYRRIIGNPFPSDRGAAFYDPGHVRAIDLSAIDPILPDEEADENRAGGSGLQLTGYEVPGIDITLIPNPGGVAQRHLITLTSDLLPV